MRFPSLRRDVRQARPLGQVGHVSISGMPLICRQLQGASLFGLRLQGLSAEEAFWALHLQDITDWYPTYRTPEKRGWNIPAEGVPLPHPLWLRRAALAGGGLSRRLILLAAPVRILNFRTLESNIHTLHIPASTLSAFYAY